MDKQAILVFGVGELQKSVILRAKAMGLHVVGIDPCPDAASREFTDDFEVIDGQDYEGTLAVASKYKVSAIITAATDKPLVMMARIAEALRLPFYSVKTAEVSTDKYLMKEIFEKAHIPCARGRLIHHASEASDLEFPLIVKPRDNSGSRGVVLCQNTDELSTAIANALEFSKKDTVLVEEFIEGQEYSIEALHFPGTSNDESSNDGTSNDVTSNDGTSNDGTSNDGTSNDRTRSVVLQFTEKTTTEFPYNVELAHKQPAQLTDTQREEIRNLISRIGGEMGFINCASHTELKINNRGIFIIETSPRLGGDYITSTLTPLSTGINIEDQLLRIALGQKPDLDTGRINAASGVAFLNLLDPKISQSQDGLHNQDNTISPNSRIIQELDPKLEEVKTWPGVISFEHKLHIGDEIHPITSSLNRYGEVIVKGDNYQQVSDLLNKYIEKINLLIV